MSTLKFSFVGIDIAGDDDQTVARFECSGEFQAYERAVSWCESLGVSVGQMQGPDPIGLLYGDFMIAKWRNLSKQQRAALDGTITGNKRYGPITVTLRAPATAAKGKP